MVTRSLFFLVLLFFFACQQQEENIKKPSTPSISLASIDDSLATRLSSFFVDSLFVNDLQYLKTDSTAFQMYKADLNLDSNEEIFIRFIDPYFCNSQGCKYLLLDSSIRVLNEFVSVEAPIWISSEQQNGWLVLLTEKDQKLKMLINKNGIYPSNPKLVPNSNISISVRDRVMFNDSLQPSKTYYF